MVYSIIIPHYNTPELLNRLLETIPDTGEYQVIVVDDCSAERLMSAVRTVVSRRRNVELYSTGSSGGGGKARNIGLAHARGRWVLFADADDFFTLCFHDVVSRHKDSDADIIYFSCNSVDVDTFRNATRDYAMHDAIDRFMRSGDERDIRFTYYVPWCKMISRDMIERHNIRFAETRVSNDILFSTLADFHATKVDADQHAIYCVTDRAGSTSKQVSDDDRLSRLNTELRRYVFLRDNNMSDRIGANRFDGHINGIIDTNNQPLLKRALTMLTDAGIDTRTLMCHIRTMRRKAYIIHALRRLHLYC